MKVYTAADPESANICVSDKQTKQHTSPETIAPNVTLNTESGDVHIHVQGGTTTVPLVNTCREVSILQQNLKTRAEEAAGEIQIPIQLDKAIKAVRLQITTESRKSLETLDQEDHFIRRDEFRSVFDTPEGNTTIGMLFSVAETNAKKEAKKLYRATELEKILRHMDKYGRSVMITGQAGIGKTVLSKMITNEILQHKLLPNTKFIFYIRFRDIDFDCKKNIVQFLVTFGGCSWKKHTEESDGVIWEAIHDNPDVVLVLDGLDEAATTALTKPAPKCNPLEPTRVAVLTGNILNRNLLPRCRMAITSRPRQVHELDTSNKPRTEFKVIGLEASAKRDLGEQICGADWPLVEAYLEQHPDVYAMCYVPVMCIVTMHCIKSQIRSNDDFKLDNVTSVLVFALDKYARSEHIRTSCDLSKLCLFAWNGFSKQKIMFTEKDFQDADISKEANEAYLTTSIDISTDLKTKLMDGDKISCFSHLIWQELLAAIHIMYFMSFDTFQEKLRFLLDSRWEVVARSMYGITSTETKKYLDKIFACQDRGEYQEKVRLMKKLAQDAAKELGDDFDGDETERILQVCTWARESNNTQFAADLRPHLPTKINLSGDVLPGDISSLMYVLKSVEGAGQVINVGSGTRFKPDNCLPNLLNEISQTDIKMEILNLSPQTAVTDIVAESIQGNFKNIQKLILGQSGITDIGLGFLSAGLCQRQQQIDELDLSGNPIQNVGATHLAHCLSKVKSLNISKCQVTDIGLETISDGISRLTTRMENFNISHTAIGDLGAKGLSQCVKNIRSLSVEKCEITDVGIEYISQGIHELATSMEEVKFAKNPINVRSAIAIASCLHNIDNLHVRSCRINDLAAEQLAKGVERRTTKVGNIFIRLFVYSL
ncbi:NACHT, LRR and PYD domains-containing protein 3-like [Ciona intestinalis]